MTVLAFIPGLGYDHRIFDFLRLSGHECIYLDWIEPKPTEPLDQYAKRLAEPIMDLPSVVLIGHSFGGITAQEIARQLSNRVKGVILLSSVVARSELPLWMKLAYPLKLNLLPIRKMSAATVGLWGSKHGFDTRQRRELFVDMVTRHSNRYFRWALHQLSVWKGQGAFPREKVFQINGTSDLTFPIARIQKPDYTIKEGNHVFMFEHGNLTSDLIEQQIKQWINSD